MGGARIGCWMHNRAAWVVALQLSVTAAIALFLVARGESLAAISALVGGGIGFVPALVYVCSMSSGRGGDPQRLLRAQYRSEFYKFVATAVLFGLTFIVFTEVVAPVLFVTYACTLAVYWVALVMR